MVQEGWSELLSETMCFRDHVWWLINLFLILIHFFVSFILVNFFTAVVLDNLDDDEETKKEKLEKELNTRKIKGVNVPWHLKVFKLFGVKHHYINPPKTFSIDPETPPPNLTETEIRNFYDTGDATDFLPLTSLEVGTFPARENPPQEVKLELLNDEVSNSFLNASHSKEQGVQNILSRVKAIRQYQHEMTISEANKTDLKQQLREHSAAVRNKDKPSE